MKIVQPTIKPIALVKKDGDGEVEAWACGKCGLVLPKELAELHCVDTLCERCGKQTEHRHYMLCNNCRAKSERDKIIAHAETAESVRAADYDGPVYTEDHSGSLGDGYSRSIDDLIDYFFDEEISDPGPVFACSVVGLSIDAADVVEGALSDHHDDAQDDITNGAVAGLQKLLNGWCEENPVESWYPDYTRVIVGIEFRQED